MERDGINLSEWVLQHKVRCGVFGYTMTRPRAKHPIYYCRTYRVSDAFACPSERVSEVDVLEAVLDALHVQAIAAVEMAHIWKEHHQRKKTDTAALREGHSKLERQIKDLYTSLENTSEDGELQNQFLVRFRSYVEADMKEITQEILSDLLSGIHVYPGGRLEIIWNYPDKYEKMMLDLKGEQQDGT